MAAIGDGWVDGAWIEAGWVTGGSPAWFAAGAGLSVAVTGSVIGADEQDIRLGAKTILLTVTNDTWVSGGAFDAARQAIIDGLDSDGVESTGWNTEVRDKLAVTTVVRTSPTVVTITLSAQAAYDIASSETITATIPLTALASAPEDPVVAAPTFTIVPYVVTATLAGTIIDAACESDIVDGGRVITLTLTNDTWVVAGAFSFDLHRQAILDGLTSAQSEAAGWNAEVRDKEAVTAVARTSDTVVTITLTAAEAYDITATETITATIPAIALTTSTLAVVAAPTFEVCTDDVVAAPSGRGGPDPRKRVPGWRPDKGRKLRPFTGRGFFPDEDEKADKADKAEKTADRSVTGSADGPGIDEVAAARARRADSQLAIARADAAAAREALEAREAEERVLAFLLAERAAAEVQAARAALAEDDEAVIRAYLASDVALRARMADILRQLLAQREQRARRVPVLVSMAGEVLDRALKGDKDEG